MSAKIIAWNVNSVAARRENFIKLMEEEKPDVILLQEIKCQSEKFPYDLIEQYGYNHAISGQKSYNGVAILSKSPLEDISTGLDHFEDENSRYIEAVTTVNGKTIRVASVYVPNGQVVDSDKFMYKMAFFKHLREHIQERLKYDEAYFIGGDYNVAPEEIDVYDPKHLEGTVGFHIKERTHIREILSIGVYDSFRALNPNKNQFSWWDYRTNGWKLNKGMRIDLILASPRGMDITNASGIIDKYRGEIKPSDHAPIWVEIAP